MANYTPSELESLFQNLSSQNLSENKDHDSGENFFLTIDRFADKHELSTKEREILGTLIEYFVPKDTHYISSAYRLAEDYKAEGTTSDLAYEVFEDAARSSDEIVRRLSYRGPKNDVASLRLSALSEVATLEHLLSTLKENIIESLLFLSDVSDNRIAKAAKMQHQSIGLRRKSRSISLKDFIQKAGHSEKECEDFVGQRFYMIGHPERHLILVEVKGSGHFGLVNEETGDSIDVDGELLRFC